MLPTFKLSIERWRFNKDFGVWVSNKGNFRNKYKKPLPKRINQSGYVSIKVDCTSRNVMYAHRLVMLTWRPTDEAENLTVDHLDHNKRNNAVDNLEWVTAVENRKRAAADHLTSEEEKELYDIEEKYIKVNGIILTIDDFCKLIQNNAVKKKLLDRLNILRKKEQNGKPHETFSKYGYTIELA